MGRRPRRAIPFAGRGRQQPVQRRRQSTPRRGSFRRRQRQAGVVPVRGAHGQRRGVHRIPQPVGRQRPQGVAAGREPRVPGPAAVNGGQIPGANGAVSVPPQPAQAVHPHPQDVQQLLRLVQPGQPADRARAGQPGPAHLVPVGAAAPVELPGQPAHILGVPPPRPVQLQEGRAGVQDDVGGQIDRHPLVGHPRDGNGPQLGGLRGQTGGHGDVRGRGGGDDDAVQVEVMAGGHRRAEFGGDAVEAGFGCGHR